VYIYARTGEGSIPFSKTERHGAREPTDVIKVRADSRIPWGLLAEETSIWHVNEKRQDLSPIDRR